MEKKSKVISKDKSTKKPVEQTKKEQPKKTTTTTTTAVTKKPETKKNDKKVTTTTTTNTTNKKPEIKKNEKKVEKVVETKKPNTSQKRKKIESSEEESSESEDLGFVPDSSEDEDEDSDFDEIQADFDLVPCVDKDYHSIKNMINRLIPYNDSSKFNGGELTDLIIAQAEKKKFGRSINIDGNEDPFGFLSILNYDQVRKAETIQGYLDYINEKLDSPEESYIDSDKCGEKTMKSLLAKLTSPTSAKSNPLGLIFCERFINIPNELIPSLYQFMQFDVELMQEKNKDKNYDFKNYLILSSYGITAKGNDDDQPPPPTKQQQDNNSSSEDEQPTKKSKSNNKGVINKKQEKKQTPPPPPPQPQEEEIEEGLLMYQKCEDKYFREHAIAWSTFDIPYQYGNGPKWTLFGHLNRKGLIMIVPATKYQQFLSDLKEKAIFD